MKSLDITAIAGNWASKVEDGSKWHCVVALVELAILNPFSGLDKSGK